MKKRSQKTRGNIAAALLAILPTVAAQASTTPIEHLVVIIGENNSFDTVFATYQPPEGQRIANLLSKKIVNKDGSPGPAYATAVQWEAKTNGRYQVDYPDGKPYQTLPRPHGRKNRESPLGLDEKVPADLPPGPFQITRFHPYGELSWSNPVHRFFQMWQQVNAGRNNLFVWTSMTSGEGGSAKPKPNSTTTYSSEGMGFYNMSTGDAPYFNELANTYAISDNYHQSIMGGSLPNYIAIATGDMASYLEDGKPAKPPEKLIENPEPYPGSPNWYVNSGYDGGSYTACADEQQFGVGAIRRYLKALPYKPFNDGNCEKDTYYMVNNLSAAYSPSGSIIPEGSGPVSAKPQTAPTIVEALTAKGVSWKWYGGSVVNKGEDKGFHKHIGPLNFFKNIMESDLKQNFAGHSDILKDSEGGMPSVSFVMPPGRQSGHPGGSTLQEYEQFVKKIVDKLRSNETLWRKTAIMITMDEGGGYYDSGYIQAIDFFGDGTRIPFIVASPWARKGVVDHTYADHASILKFIERNWGLQPLSKRSRDNLPNPKPGSDAYIPANRPAIGDLFEMFDFSGNTKNAFN